MKKYLRERRYENYYRCDSGGHAHNNEDHLDAINCGYKGG